MKKPTANLIYFSSSDGASAIRVKLTLWYVANGWSRQTRHNIYMRTMVQQFHDPQKEKIMTKTIEAAQTIEEQATPTATTIKSKTGKATPKSKEALGVPESHTIVWVGFDLAPDDHALISAIIKGRKIETRQLFVPVLREWLDKNRDALITEAEDYSSKTELTSEQVTAKMAAAERQMEKYRTMLKRYDND